MLHGGGVQAKNQEPDAWKLARPVLRGENTQVSTYLDTYNISVANLSTQPRHHLARHRIMVIGNNVVTVQRVSRYCLEKGAEVFPHYGIRTDEDNDCVCPQCLGAVSTIA